MQKRCFQAVRTSLISGESKRGRERRTYRLRKNCGELFLSLQKFENRSTKHETNPKIEARNNRIPLFEFQILNLFRISIFVLRIFSSVLIPIKQKLRGRRSKQGRAW